MSSTKSQFTSGLFIEAHPKKIILKHFSIKDDQLITCGTKHIAYLFLHYRVFLIYQISVVESENTLIFPECSVALG